MATMGDWSGTHRYSQSANSTTHRGNIRTGVVIQDYTNDTMSVGRNSVYTTKNLGHLIQYGKVT